jgi:hypothetical protein
MWQKIVAWWNSYKEAIENFVLPKLDLAIIPLQNFLISKGVPANFAAIASKEAIGWLKTYLQRQL